MKCDYCPALDTKYLSKYCRLGDSLQYEIGFKMKCRRRSIEKIVNELAALSELKADFYAKDGKYKNKFE